MGGLTDVLALCYHGVSPTWPAVTAVRPDQLGSQLRGMVDRGYRGATFTDALTAPASAKTLVVTFDDAHRSVLELAHPIMSELGIPGTVFAPTDFVSAGRPMAWQGIDGWIGGPHEHELACMSWDELRTLADDGWEIGSHTRSHPHLTRLDDARLEAELAGSRELLEDRLGRECSSLAYPYGECDERVVRAARAAGYRVAATVPPDYGVPLPLQWPRIDIAQRDTALRFRMRVSPLMRRLALSPTGRPLLAAARASTRGPRRAARTLRWRA